MAVHHYETEFGRYTVFYVPEKKRANANFSTCIDEERLADHLVKSCKALGAKSVYVTPYKTDAFLNRTPHYTIDRYDIEKVFDVPSYYTLEVLSKRTRKVYVKLTREATFDVDNMSYTDLDEANYYMKNPDSVIGLIRFRHRIIGTFVHTKGEIESVAIAKRYRGKGHAYHAIGCVIQSMGGKASLLVSSRNEPALSIYKKMGFIKTDLQTTRWFQLL